MWYSWLNVFDHLLATGKEKYWFRTLRRKRCAGIQKALIKCRCLSS
jgi:hypothetical protein